MRILVLGGTWFVGRTLVEAITDAGHRVTLFNRGRTAARLPDEAEAVHGDRESVEDLRRLANLGPWDAVIDVAGVVPAAVRDAAKVLAPVTGRYVFVSTVSVYRDWPREAVAEESPLHQGDPDTRPPAWKWGTGVYGPLKAGAEIAVHRELGDERTTILRPGVILGPYEYSGRLTWWLTRAARGGRILAPGEPDRFIRPIDARDLAAFTLHLIVSGVSGAFNVAGPAGRDTFGAMLDACLAATGATGAAVWVDDDWLTANGVKQWTELPLWRTATGTWAIDTTRAEAEGLICRPIRATVRDTWAWMHSGDIPVEHERQATHGIAPDREAALLTAWDLAGHEPAGNA
ncbi:NAD-dependent epimerase/dehydratase family protein [Phytohabitans kaempferiae]|uniref:NAD-dependent epimerase/dehydratase family protein n=1 Tax=Phytohabitans kaempferiae TaxID=1620943 RepID=A0ABV6M720_9ACTN